MVDKGGPWKPNVGWTNVGWTGGQAPCRILSNCRTNVPDPNLRDPKMSARRSRSDKKQVGKLAAIVQNCFLASRSMNCPALSGHSRGLTWFDTCLVFSSLCPWSLFKLRFSHEKIAAIVTSAVHRSQIPRRNCDTLHLYRHVLPPCQC
jgi:hypothetical protein